jgi:hypothetical protein
VAIRAVDNSDDIARFVAAEMAKRQQWTCRLPEGLH